MNGLSVTLFTTRFMEKLSERPEIGEIYSSYDVNYPQYRVDLDVARCKKMGIAPSTVLNEMGAYLGGDYISNFNNYNKVYQVDLQLRPSDRNRPESLASLFVRSESGEMMPINQFVSLTKEYMPQSINSFNMFPSIDVSGSVAEGSSSGRAIKAIQETAAKELPVDYSIEFGGITREESQTSGRVFFICCLSCFRKFRKESLKTNQYNESQIQRQCNPLAAATRRPRAVHSRQPAGVQVRSHRGVRSP